MQGVSKHLISIPLNILILVISHFLVGKNTKQDSEIALRIAKMKKVG